jgi:hypothetical protein
LDGVLDKQHEPTRAEKTVEVYEGGGISDFGVVQSSSKKRKSCCATGGEGAKE